MSRKKLFSPSETGAARAARSLLALLFALTLGAFAERSSLAQNNSVGQPVAASSTAASLPVQNSYAAIVSRVAPAVVTVRSERRVKADDSALLDTPILRELFGDQMPRGQQRQQHQPRTEKQEGLGSGVIVSPDGYRSE